MIGDAPLGVAVSGGGDSMALLALLLEAGLTPQVATVHHHLRDEAGAEVAAVVAFCADHGLIHTQLDWHWDGTGNLQDQGRRARYRLLAAWASERALAHIALGHTADDNAETFLMGLSRGAGLDGLSGMRARFKRGAVTFHRPLLSVSRADLRDLLRAKGIAWADDPSNDDPAYHRVRIRQAMDALSSAGIDPAAIQKTIGNLAATRSDISLDLARALEGRFELYHGDILFDLPWLERQTMETRRRVLKAAIRVVSGQDYPPRGDKLARLAGDLRSKSALQGCLFSNDGTHLRVSREFAAVDAMAVPSDAVWDDRWVADGPHADGLTLRALGEDGLTQVDDDWRALGLPRASVLASPSIWRGATLRSAPLAGWPEGWKIRLCKDAPQLIGSILLH
ncbi:tRNA(Ile)-lysidine synthase [Litoreibacter ponti]|uniref:tRNA(Ile)-lysidine synthase n=1 Tax=Litoreibacter ponti TaxID=1510457 RepID=A0A2T6BLF8_9RHOB|nr:tRNA lysidine(34) synthetase TilS [Litoreibacter ponti]PTX56913.1 tRNA(Ile)-lysidine synthase [Litoreibacter ponti]